MALDECELCKFGKKTNQTKPVILIAKRVGSLGRFFSPILNGMPGKTGSRGPRLLMACLFVFFFSVKMAFFFRKGL